MVRSGGRLWDRLREGYWLVPLTCVIISVGAAFALIALDRYLQDNAIGWTYAGGPQNASDTLTTIASSMITFTGLVFSITVLALQLTSSQFSPRALRNFLRDRVAQFSLGIFIATFAYSFAALSAVRVASDDDPSFVPGITVTGAFVLIAISLIAFVQYIHHTAQSIRAVTIIERIADETRTTIDQMYPHDAATADVRKTELRTRGTPQVLGACRAGVIVDVDLDAMASFAAARGASVEVLRPIGEYVCEGQPVMSIWTDADDRTGVAGGFGAADAPGGSGGNGHGTRRAGRREQDGWDGLHDFVFLDSERTIRNDAAFGLRQLVDIAERALSPGVNDPTTAVQCLDRIHDLLRRLSGRHLPTLRTGEHDGEVRATEPSPSFDDFLVLGTEEIRWWGRESIQVQRRLSSMFDDLLAATDDPARRAVIATRRAESLELRAERSSGRHDLASQRSKQETSSS